MAKTPGFFLHLRTGHPSEHSTNNSTAIDKMKTKTIWTAIALLAASSIAGFAQDEKKPDEGQRERRRGQVPPAVLKEFDKDGDGKLNDEERKAMREAAHKKMLEKYDKDKDGKLNDEERKAMREDMEAKRKALLEKYDKDKDGRLSAEERKAAVDAGEELPMWGGPGGRGPRGDRGPRGGDTDKPGE